MGEVPAVHAWPTNAHLIADVARLGYIGPNDRVLDTTWGRKGAWWKIHRPQHLVGIGLRPTNQLWTTGMLDADFRDLPFRDGAFDVVAFDPPYKLNGTPALDDFDTRYGLNVGYVPWQERHKLIKRGTDECLRALARGGRLLLKCKDQVCSGKVRWQTAEFTEYAVYDEPGGRVELIDRFDMVTRPQPQPVGRRQIHARRNASTLLVFQKT